MSRVVTALDELGTATARTVVAEWQGSERVDSAWLTWIDDLIRLAATGRLQPATHRPLPAFGADSFLGRDRQVAELNTFLDRVQQGRGGAALVLGPAGIGKSHLLGTVLASPPRGIRVEWTTLDRSEAGYRGWRRLLAPLWITLRRTELAPADLLVHAAVLDDILLAGGDDDDDLTAMRFPGEVAAAVAALLAHAAIRQPLVLVIDDAHRGGVSSDHLLADVARRISGYQVGIIAAVRHDELDQRSPFRSHGDQADDRAAPDVVLPVHVPPLEPGSAARLLQERTGAEPPSEIVEAVLRQTGGCPQLIRHTQVQAPASRTSSAWVVGKLDAEGLRVLEPTIESRPGDVRDVLHAAAVCAIGGHIDPGLLSRVTDLPADVVERILEQERQAGPILAPQAPGYSFQHDNWIDALTAFCPPARLRALHARCLVLLRDDPAADPQQLAWHAVHAGADVVGPETFARLATRAADQAFADYAYATAAELYGAASQYSAGRNRIELLIRQADALRFRGAWNEARSVLKSAASLARTLGIPGHEAIVLIHLERLIWSYGLDEKHVAQQLRDVIRRLPREDHVLRAQAQAALALRLSITARQYENEQADFARAALQELPAVTDPLERADILLGIRAGLQDDATPDTLLAYGEETFNEGIKSHSAYHIGEALISRIIDLIRAGRLLELPSAMRKYRDFAEHSAAPVVVYSLVLTDAMLSLARGEFDAAKERTAEAAGLSSSWGESMASEAIMAQAGWRLYEIGEVDGLSEILTGLPQQDVSTLNEEVWSLGAGLIHAEQGEFVSASHRLREVGRGTGEFKNLSRGPSRIGILATAATLLGHPALCDALPPDEAIRWGRSLADLLTNHHDSHVLAGWPAVMLGSKHRYIGLAELAAKQPATAVTHLVRAAAENSEFAALHVRTRFDLGRGFIRQSATHAQGITEMKRVAQDATDRKMPKLAAQAAIELDHWHGTE
jgi:hypothetical protein